VSLLEAKNVSKVYQMGSTTVAALDHVSISVNQGEFVAIQGTSGSGKSTLLNVLGGLDQATSGEVFFDSQSLAPLNKREKARYRRDSVGMIFQNFNLITTMSAATALIACSGLENSVRPDTQSLLKRVRGIPGKFWQGLAAFMSGGEPKKLLASWLVS